MKNQRKATYIGVFILLSIGYWLLRGSTWQGSTELHTLMETVATVLALVVGVLALVRFYSRKNNTFLFIGTGFLGTAFLDGYHAVVTSTFFAHHFPSVPASLIPWSWIASRLFLSILLWLSLIAWRREERKGAKGRISEGIIYALVSAMTLACFFFFALVPLPRAYYPELFFHRPEELVPAFFFLWALIGYWRKGHWKHSVFEHWLMLCLIVSFMGQAMFMSFSGQLFDMMFDAAHLLKKLSYLCVLTGLAISMYQLFRQAEDGVEEIAGVNRSLQREVTERLQAEENLRESEETFRMISASAQDAILMMDNEGKIAYWNDAAVRIFGYEPQEALGKGLHILLAPASYHEAYRNGFAQFQSTGQGDVIGKTLELTAVRKDGTEFPIELSVAAVQLKGQWQAVGVLRDITERKQAEEKLQQQKAFFGNVIDSLSHPLLVIDANTYRVEWANSATGLGALPENLACYALTHQKTEPCGGMEHPCPLTTVKETKKPALVEHIHCDKEGRPRSIEVYAFPIFDRDGEVKQVVEYSLDITERKQSEDQIRRQGQILDAINRVFREALICEDVEELASTSLQLAEELTGSKFGFIGEVNESGRLDTIALSDPGWETCQMPASDAVQLIKNMTIRGIWSATLRAGQSQIVNDPSSHPERVGTPEGHPELTSFLGVPLRRGETTFGMIGLANKEAGYDLDDQEKIEALSVALVEALIRKRAEEELRDFSARLEQSNRELQDFAYVASHDLQEPLRKVQAFGERLGTRYGDALDERGKDYLERMQNAAERMQIFVNDLLTLSRVTTRAQSFSPVDLNEIGKEVISDLEEHIEQVGGQIELGDLPTIAADPTQMRQLIQNLISNSLKFYREGMTPVIKVHASIMKEQAQPRSLDVSRDRFCHLFVEDNGIGFDEKYLDRVFAPFQRLHSRSEYEGTGMGLAICRKIVERHQGTITASSTPGKGTTFTVVLPVQQSKGRERL